MRQNTAGWQVQNQPKSQPIAAFSAFDNHFDSRKMQICRLAHGVSISLNCEWLGEFVMIFLESYPNIMNSVAG